MTNNKYIKDLGDRYMNAFERWKQQLWFIAELIIISAVLSYLIKYGGAYLPLSGTSSQALFIVLLPTVVIAIALYLRYLFHKKQG